MYDSYSRGAPRSAPMQADDFAGYSQHTLSQSMHKTGEEEEGMDTEGSYSEEEVDSQPPPPPPHKSSGANLSQKEIKKLAKHIGQIEGKVTEISKKYQELKEKTKKQDQDIATCAVQKPA